MKGARRLRVSREETAATGPVGPALGAGPVWSNKKTHPDLRWAGIDRKTRGTAYGIAGLVLSSTRMTSIGVSPMFSGRWSPAGVARTSPPLTLISSVFPSG